MSDRVGNPEDRFSRVAAHMVHDYSGFGKKDYDSGFGKKNLVL